MRISPFILALGLATPGLSNAAQLEELNVETYTLKNGLTVLLSRDTTLPVVAVEVRYLVGSANEEDGQEGFAHLFEHLMFQGSGHFDNEYFAPFMKIGGDINGTTSFDRTNYFERVPSNYLELALWMESDRMAYLLDALSEEKLQNQRDVVLNERRQRYEDQPYGMAHARIYEAIYKSGHPYDHTAIGNPESLNAATLDTARNFFHRYYAPSNAVLTLAGDFETSEAKKLIEAYFGPIAGSEVPPRPKAEPVVLTEEIHLTEEDNVPLPRVYLAWPTPAIFEEGDAALDLLSALLTDGKTTRLYQPLVYEQKIAKDVNAYQASSRISSVFVVQATAAQGQSLDDLVKALDESLEKALATPPTEAEFSRILHAFEKSFFYRFEGVLDRAHEISNYWHLTGNAASARADLARYTNLNANDVQNAAAWLKKPRVRLDVIPRSK